MRLKKIDRLLVTGFIPPFIVTFFIALFVLVLQTLWLYIDDIAGKGVGFFLMIELVGYMSVSMVPMALPVAVLISSVMVLGNLAERYELSSIKSAGISLWRTMFPLMVVTLCISVFSFFCSNYFIPVSNLKFKSRLHDIKNQKPALSMEEALFNNDFQGYSIRIDDKLADGQTIRDVMVYDNREANQGRISLVTADSGNMYGSKDGKFFVMQLYDGYQYAEPKPVNKSGKRTYPMMRASFEEWTKVFDLDEFELDRTDENLFKSHHSMLSNRQLLIAVDSIDVEIGERISRMEESTNKYYHFWNEAFETQKREERKKAAELQRAKVAAERDSLKKIAREQAVETDSPADSGSERKPVPELKKIEKVPLRKPISPPASEESDDEEREPVRRVSPASALQPISAEWRQTIKGDLKSYGSILATFPEKKQPELLDKAKATARTLRDQAETTVKSLERTKESRVKHVFEFNSKFSMAIACFIFLFVGAPMGAIVRKGGFGWPLLISIVFFMLFIVISIFSKNIAERFVIDAVLASWMNCLVVFPMGLVLTYWAMRDIGWTQLVDFFKVKLPTRKSLKT